MAKYLGADAPRDGLIVPLRDKAVIRALIGEALSFHTDCDEGPIHILTDCETLQNTPELRALMPRIACLHLHGPIPETWRGVTCIKACSPH